MVFFSDQDGKQGIYNCWPYEEKKKVQEQKEKEAAEKNTWKDPKVKGMKQLSLAETEARVKPWDIKDPRAIHVHQKIAEMMALDFQPYSIVSDTGFTELLKTLEPNTPCQVTAISLRMLYLVLQMISIQS